MGSRSRLRHCSNKKSLVRIAAESSLGVSKMRWAGTHRGLELEWPDFNFHLLYPWSVDLRKQQPYGQGEIAVDKILFPWQNAKAQHSTGWSTLPSET